MKRAKKVNKSILFYALIAIMIAMLSACGSDSEKRSNAEAALQAKQQEKESKEKAIENDKISPKITSSVDKVTYEICDTINYDTIKSCLTAIDDVDGDISDRIEFKYSNIEEGEKGEYKVEFEVSDSANNTSTYSIPVEITSKYDHEEEVRLGSCITAYNALKDSLKYPNSLEAYGFYTTIYSAHVVIDYSATNSYGGRIREYATYDEDIDYLSSTKSCDLSKYTYVYSFDEVVEFSDYYHGK